MNAPDRTNPQEPATRLLYDRKAAAPMLSISVRSLDYYLAAGKFKTRRIGRKVLIPHSELVKFASRDHWERVDGRNTEDDPNHGQG
jgi:hypothetical protein